MLPTSVFSGREMGATEGRVGAWSLLSSRRILSWVGEVWGEGRGRESGEEVK